MEFTIGTNLDNRLILLTNALLKKYNMDYSNISFFGTFPGFNLSIDRHYKKNVDITLNEFIAHIRLIKKNDFNFRFIINNISDSFETMKPNLDKILEILKDNDFSLLTVYNKEIISYINKKYGDYFKIGLSTIIRIDSVEKLKKYLLIGSDIIDKVIFSHGVNYDIEKIVDLVKFCKTKNITTELLGNEFVWCDSSCDICDGYIYTNIEKGGGVLYGKSDYCCGVHNRLKDYLNSNFIRPEEVYIYENLGIDSIKIGTRKVETSRIIKIINSYLLRKHEGNIFSLLGDQFDDRRPCIPNRKLDNKFFNYINYNKYIESNNKK